MPTIQGISRRLKNMNAVLYPQRIFHSPDWIVLGVNNICNLHCKMCDVGLDYQQSNFYHNLMGAKPLHMPLELFKMVIDQSSKDFPKAKIGYAFTEPLMYAHLDESLQYAKKKGRYTTITTNGFNLESQAAKLAAGGLKELFVSLDGPAAVHDFIRGREGAFEKAIAGIEKLASLNKDVQVSIFCVITEWNTNKLLQFLEAVQHLPLKEVGFMHTNYTLQHTADMHNLSFGSSYPATISNIAETQPGNTNLEELEIEIIQIKKRQWKFKVSFSPDLTTRQQLEVFYLHPEIFIGRRCHDTFNAIMIKSNGDAIPAHGRCYNLTVGNLYEHTLQRTWNSAVFAQFRKTLIRNGGLLPACSRCCSAFAQ
jgi:Fe-coproporphyrin III synthase